MKRIAIPLLAGMLFVPSIVVASETDENETDKKDGPVNNGKLNIDDLVDHAFEDETTLTILDLQYEIMRNSIGKMEDELDDLEDTDPSDEIGEIDEGLLPTDESEIREEIEDQFSDLDENIPDFLIDLQIEQMVQTQLQINATLNGFIEAQMEQEVSQMEDQLDDARDQLEDQLEDLEHQQQQFFFQRRDAELGIELMVRGAFIEAYMQQEQVELLTNMDEQMDREKEQAELMYELGFTSTHEYEGMLDQFADITDERTSAEEDLERTIARMSLEYGFDYGEDLTFEKPDIGDIEEIEKEDIDDLIDGSYEVVQAKEDIKRQEDIIDDASGDEEVGAMLELDILEEELEQQKLDLENDIRDIYASVDDAIDDIESAESDIESFERDLDMAKAEYHLGLISKHELDQKENERQELDMQLDSAKIAYYMAVQQVEAMEDGYIQAPMDGGMGGDISTGSMPSMDSPDASGGADMSAPNMGGVPGGIS
ncbi:TolC family protein [Texcoconibacillus texcoconensis]|uniref:Multidrug efflux pump subunit AcrA (Membrane-fusion protein) n=1 Tax=Texcoconibacillus texcoconensis TaxID=1095777 RepID=A0A840QQ76_9BACI|nr:TolC family protein [Texcoconibacillus texcoconensis]MBB5173491.1 multidrug efflux pump subunit AcrA (membrane-fusion protein) [Texcoconibacillus texcoconensis]